eukprot:749995-Pleurochrysis_carterae.AAC.1
MFFVVVTETHPSVEHALACDAQAQTLPHGNHDYSTTSTASATYATFLGSRESLRLCSDMHGLYLRACVGIALDAFLWMPHSENYSSTAACLHQRLHARARAHERARVRGRGRGRGCGCGRGRG